MTLMMGNATVSKIVIGEDTFINQSGMWLPYPNGGGKLFYRFESDTVLEIWGFETVESNSSTDFSLKAIAGTRFKTWHANASKQITGTLRYGSGGTVTGRYNISSDGSSIGLTGTDGKGIGVSGCCFFCPDEDSINLTIAGAYSVKIDIEKV